MGNGNLSNQRNFNNCSLRNTTLTKSSLENEIIESKIGGVYKKVWMLLNIDSENAQLNPLTFMKGYLSAVVLSCAMVYL